MTELAYRLALAAVFLGVVAGGALLSRRYGRPVADVPRSADGPVMAAALAAGGLGYYGGLLAFIVWPPLLAWSAMGLPATVRWAGLILLALGAALALWARFTLGRSSTVTGVPAPGAELVTRGPYRRLRHPIYSAGLLMIPGAAALTDSAFILGVGVVMLVVLDIRTRREERLLLDRFGDAYRRQMDRTHRWLPRLRLPPALLLALAAAVPAAASAQQPGDTLVVPVPGTGQALALGWIPAPEPFWMTIHEVTDAQYGPFRYRRLDSDAAAESYDADAVTRPSPPYEDPVHGMGKGGHPAGGMTRLAALRYARWLSEKTGRLFTLPTEAEWELACLAGGPGPYGLAAGGEAATLDDVAWYEANSRGAFHPVGEKRPNALGLYDMHGNVAEWVLAGDPRGRGVVRGGAFDDPPEALRCDARVEEPAAWKRRDPQIPKSRWWNTDSPHVGFRLVSPAGDHDLEAIRAYWAELLGG